jgi:hypothetical protein
MKSQYPTSAMMYFVARVGRKQLHPTSFYETEIFVNSKNVKSPNDVRKLEKTDQTPQPYSHVFIS